jgi:hypothetical protein
MTSEQTTACIAIYSSLALYHTSLDAGDIAGVQRAFAEEATMQNKNGPPWHGNCAIASALQKRAKERGFGTRGDIFQRHHLTTRRIDFLGHANAEGLCYWHVTSELGLDHFGCYIDRYSKRGELWLIKESACFHRLDASKFALPH